VSPAPPPPAHDRPKAGVTANTPQTRLWSEPPPPLRACLLSVLAVRPAVAI
jgi:hypothetical protein